MSPVGLVLRKPPNPHSQNRWDKKRSTFTDSANEKRDDNSHHSNSITNNSNGGSSHGFGGFSGFSGFSTSQNGGSGSNKNSGFNFSSGGFRNGGLAFNNDGGGDNSNKSGSSSGGSGSNNDGSGSGGSSSNGSKNNNSGSGSDGGGSDSSNNGSSNNNDSSGHGSSNNNSGDSSKNTSTSTSGSNLNGNNNAGGGATQTVTTTFFSPSTNPSPTGQDNIPPSTVLIDSTVSPFPSPTSGGLPPTEQLAIHHVSLPLGSIVAIILGILFCIAIGGVIYVVTRPKFGSLGRLWRQSKVSLPSIAAYEPKEIRDSSNLYRPYQPPDLSSFRFGLNAPHQGRNESSSRGYDNFQIQIYSTRLPGSSSPKAQQSLTSLHSENEDDSEESLTRIMSMMDRYPLERDSSVDSGQISPSPSDHLPLNNAHYRHPDYPRSVGPETTSGE